MTTSDRPAAARKGTLEDAHARALNRVVDKLPRKGAILIVHSHGELPAMRRLVQVRRGPAIAEKMRVVVAATEADERLAVGGISIPVIRSPFLAEQRAHAAALAKVWSA